ncbi:tRNA preQ1(34) S-adenosylmethionine ribosyltransferase-isomerase QueA [Roseomonas elaeocarpi]|uniref:S-adenosylmethionine:tRNA ribosyltransferase-isomerase n=1 Tax=Roseomonas elaeocarpi TaxID=907779 RepID=A0ABV6JU96_9PROT
MRTGDFDFALPDALIAQSPARPRDSARLLDVRTDGLADRIVSALPELLEPGDLLVVNDTRVIPARLRARRGEAGIELLLNRSEGGGRWHALARNAKKLHPGDALEILGAPELPARVVERQDGGAVIVDFGPDEAALLSALERAGEVPLPPYIARPGGPGAADREDYQTVFADRPGAVAAPTASLHFTPALLAALDARGIERVTVTLHVGAGTFLPVRGENPREHRLHSEWGEITPEAAARINAARRVVSVGTTALRLLESAAREDGTVAPFRGLTDLFLLPGHRFRTASLLLTNFHLPRSTLFMLVCAYAGTERVRAAYEHAIQQGYRFYSYGDATLLRREDPS